MWARARYDFRLSDAEFWALTPRQFTLLAERHREDLVHREMVSAFTTAAMINHSQFRPEPAVSPLRWMPNHKDREREPAPLSEERQAEKDAYMAQVYEMAHRLKQQHRSLDAI